MEPARNINHFRQKTERGAASRACGRRGVVRPEAATRPPRARPRGRQSRDERQLRRLNGINLFTFGHRPVFSGSGKPAASPPKSARARDEPVGHRGDAVTFTPLQLRSCPTSSSSSGHPCRRGAGLALGALLRRGATSLHLYGGRLHRETQQNVMEIDSEGLRAHASVQPRHSSP